jgi:hypothetical protein
MQIENIISICISFILGSITVLILFKLINNILVVARKNYPLKSVPTRCFDDENLLAS